MLYFSGRPLVSWVSGFEGFELDFFIGLVVLYWSFDSGLARVFFCLFSLSLSTLFVTFGLSCLRKGASPESKQNGLISFICCGEGCELLLYWC